MMRTLACCAALGFALAPIAAADPLTASLIICTADGPRRAPPPDEDGDQAAVPCHGATVVRRTHRPPKRPVR